MALYSRIIAWKISWIEEPSGLEFMGHKKLDMTRQLSKMFTNCHWSKHLNYLGPVSFLSPS